MRHFFAKFLDPVFDTRKLHGSTGVVGCLHHAEIAREVEGLVHIEGCYELPSEKVTAGIAGYDVRRLINAVIFADRASL